jgi:hypothetical protein
MVGERDVLNPIAKQVPKAKRINVYHTVVEFGVQIALIGLIVAVGHLHMTDIARLVSNEYFQMMNAVKKYMLTLKKLW